MLRIPAAVLAYRRSIGSQEDIAAIAGLGLRTVAKIEAQHEGIGVRSLLAYLRALNCRLEIRVARPRDADQGLHGEDRDPSWRG